MKKPTIEEAPRFLTRFYLIAIAPIVIVWTIVGRTWTEVRRIPFYVRCDLMCEFHEFCRCWRAAGSNRK